MISGWKIRRHVSKGVREIYLDEKKVSCIPAQPEGLSQSTCGNGVREE